MPVIKGFVALALAFVGLPAAAQQNAPQAGESYSHRGSQMVAPASLEGLSRGEIRDSTGTGRDVMIQYGTPDQSSFLSVYFYRSPHRSAALWFEQARRALESNPILGTKFQAGPVEGFSTPGAVATDGLLVSYRLGDRFRSTAVAVITVGNWIVKLRMTSSTLDEQALSERVVAAAQALVWPTRGATAAATAIAPCAERLPAAANARNARPNAAVRAEALRSVVASAHGAAQPALCFDRQEGQLGVYRESRIDGYLLALGDNGRFARVRRIESGAAEGLYAVEFYDIDAAYLAGFFRTLPTPQQALQVSDSVYRSQDGGVPYLETDIRSDENGVIPVI
jgi:hypothetical protein